MSGERISHHGPICPYCGHEHQADEAHYYDESFGEHECHSCEKAYHVVTSVSWTWRSRTVQKFREDIE